MTIRAQDVVPISEARARLTELADVVAGAEKVLHEERRGFRRDRRCEEADSTTSLSAANVVAC